MKKFRVDTFGNGHKKKVFTDEADARKYARAQKESGKIVFILEELGTDLYDVMEEV